MSQYGTNVKKILYSSFVLLSKSYLAASFYLRSFEVIMNAYKDLSKNVNLKALR